MREVPEALRPTLKKEIFKEYRHKSIVRKGRFLKCYAGAFIGLLLNNFIFQKEEIFSFNEMVTWPFILGTIIMALVEPVIYLEIKNKHEIRLIRSLKCEKEEG